MILCQSLEECLFLGISYDGSMWNKVSTLTCFRTDRTSTYVSSQCRIVCLLALSWIGWALDVVRLYFELLVQYWWDGAYIPWHAPRSGAHVLCWVHTDVYDVTPVEYLEESLSQDTLSSVLMVKMASNSALPSGGLVQWVTMEQMWIN